MTVTGQPPDIRCHHLIGRAHQPVLPPRQGTRLRRRVELRDIGRAAPFSRPAVHDDGGAIMAAREEIRRMRHRPAALARPAQPERLRRNASNSRVEIQQHQMVPLQPGLKPHMPARRRRPPQPAQMPLALPGGEPPHRPETLERQRLRLRQQHTTAGTVFRHELDLEPTQRPAADRRSGLRRQRRHTRHSPPARPRSPAATRKVNPDFARSLAT
jgi:hypothetical protein